MIETDHQWEMSESIFVHALMVLFVLEKEKNASRGSRW